MRVIAVRGEIDIAEADRLDEAIATTSAPAMVDLRDCAFMGSEGLRALFAGRKLAIEHGRRLVLCVEPGGRVARLLEIVGAESIFNICHDRESAVALAASLDRRQAPDRRAGRAAA